MGETVNILVAGVGGQGNILASRVIAMAAIKVGHCVRGCDTLGASQRSGHVTSHVRIGGEIYSPFIPNNMAQIVLGFDPLDVLLEARLISPSAVAIVNTEKILPAAVKSGKKGYPENILGTIQGIVQELHTFNAVDLAKKAGDARTLNIVLVGSLAATGRLPIPPEIFKDAISEVVPKGTLSMNLRAFVVGYQAISRSTLPKAFRGSGIK